MAAQQEALAIRVAEMLEAQKASLEEQKAAFVTPHPSDYTGGGAVADQVMSVDYGDFKSAIKDSNRHAAVMNVWAAMYLWRANAIPAGVAARNKRPRK